MASEGGIDWTDAGIFDPSYWGAGGGGSPPLAPPARHPIQEVQPEHRIKGLPGIVDIALHPEARAEFETAQRVFERLTAQGPGKLATASFRAPQSPTSGAAIVQRGVQGGGLQAGAARASQWAQAIQDLARLLGQLFGWNPTAAAVAQGGAATTRLPAIPSGGGLPSGALPASPTGGTSVPTPGGVPSMPLSFTGSDFTGGDLLGGLLNVGGQLLGGYVASKLPAPYGTPSQPTGIGSIFDIPGVDIQSPIVLESTKSAQAVAAAGMAAVASPFHLSAAGRAVPQVHLAVNPTSGKIEWFHPVKPTGFRLTHKMFRAKRGCCCRKR